VALPFVLYWLPIRVQPRQLVLGALLYWALVGGLLFWRAQALFAQAAQQGQLTPSSGMDYLAIGVAVAAAAGVGLLKGRFVLSKSSLRNVQRLQALQGPQRLSAMYPTASWAIVSVMAIVGMTLSQVPVLPLFARGLILLAVSLGLWSSAPIYWQAWSHPSAVTPATTTTTEEEEPIT
jgi:hypothetical protein